MAGAGVGVDQYPGSSRALGNYCMVFSRLWQHGYMSHVTPPPESAKFEFKFELANQEASAVPN